MARFRLINRTKIRNAEKDAVKRGKAQVFYTDFMVGVLIFIFALLIYIAYISNFTQRDDNKLNELVTSISTVSSSLISSGVPDDWDYGNAERIGLTNDNHRIDLDKLDSFQDMNYNISKKLLPTKFNYVVFLEDNDGAVIPINSKCSIGRPEVVADYSDLCAVPNMSLVDVKNIVTDTRLVIYESKITRMRIYLWD